MGADGSNPTRLTYGAGFRGAISWSPDGGRIAFDCGTTICAINRDGTNLVQLAPAGSNASRAMFSPVGGDIAFMTGGSLTVMKADGSIVGVTAGVSQPTWSPDGRSFAFVVPATWTPGGACNADGSPCGRTPDYTYAVEADGSGLRCSLRHQPGMVRPAPRATVGRIHDHMRRENVPVQCRGIVRSGWHNRELRVEVRRWHHRLRASAGAHLRVFERQQVCRDADRYRW